jgi:hypothetical protein
MFCNSFGAAGKLFRFSGSATFDLEQVHPLLEQLFEFFDRPALEEHVPVRARWLDLLGLRGSSLEQRTLQAVAALPRAGDLGIVCERHIELFTVVASVASDSTRREVVVAVCLVTYGAEAATS